MKRLPRGTHNAGLTHSCKRQLKRKFWNYLIMGSFIPFLIANGLALFIGPKESWLYGGWKWAKKSWCRQDCLPRFVSVSTIGSWMQLPVKTTFRYPSSTKLEHLDGHEYYCFLDGYSGYNQIPITTEDQEKTTFTCPFGTFSYRRLPFGLCNAPATFQRACSVCSPTW